MKKLIIPILLFISFSASAQDWKKYYEDHRRFLSTMHDTIYVNLGNSGNKIVGINSSNKLYATSIDPANIATTSQLAKTLSSQCTDASNVSTTETDLLSYTLPASTLVNNGDRVVIEGMFTTPSNGNSKSMKFYFGAASVDWGSSTIANGATIFIRATIYKNGSNTQRIQIERITGYSDFPVYSTATETDSGSIVIKFSGTGAASADITQRTMSVTYYPTP
jgi:hypothetical protein